jgi:hypothetical protein
MKAATVHLLAAGVNTIPYESPILAASMFVSLLLSRTLSQNRCFNGQQGRDPKEERGSKS